MIGIVFKPVKRASIRNGEGLYDAVFNRGEKLFRIRAKNAPEAERKLMIMFRRETKDKTFEFSTVGLEEYDSISQT